MFNFELFQKIKNKIFPFYKSKDLKFVFNKIQECNPEGTKSAMFVGGCVRRYLFNKEIDDIDIATIIRPDVIVDKFKNTRFTVVNSGIDHGTVTLVSKKIKLELTTLRKDIKTDGRHAKVEFTKDWQEDSNRRDFTINAIYLDINGKIFDPQLGTKDLVNNNIKFIGDPQKRIEEDYLRIIRFIRFSLEYDSSPDKSTIQAIKLNLDGIKKISKERILSELFKILSLKNFTKINSKTELKEIFSLIFPEFLYLERLNKLNEISLDKNLDTSIILSLILNDNKNNHEYFLHKYNISTNLKDKLQLFAKNFKNLQDNNKFLNKDLKKNVFYFGKDHLFGLNMLKFSCDKKIKSQQYFKILKDIEDISLPKFPIDGNYLRKRGVDEGVLMGKILKNLETLWLNNDFKISDKQITKVINEYKI